MSAERLAVGWTVWLRTILAAVAANLVLRAAALLVFDIPVAFEPLATAAPTVFLTTVGVAVGLGVAVAVNGSSAHPVRLYQRIVLVALLLSLVPDLWMLTASGREAYPDATLPAVITLMVQHVAAAAIVLRGVTGRVGWTS